jgi:hypothetical protein
MLELSLLRGEVRMNVPIVGFLTPNGVAAWKELLESLSDKRRAVLERKLTLEYVTDENDHPRQLIIPEDTEVSLFCHLLNFGCKNSGAP